MFFAFILIRLAPGDPITTALGTEVTPDVIARLRSELGLDDNIAMQFANYVTGLVRGDLGSSLLSNVPVATTIVLLSYMMGVMIGSTVILETVFSLPGIGRELVSAVNLRDYPVVQSIILVFGILVVVLSLTGDVVARWLDSRVKWT